MDTLSAIVDALPNPPATSPMQHLYRAFSTLHAVVTIERLEKDALLSFALEDLKKGIDGLRAEAIG